MSRRVLFIAVLVGLLLALAGCTTTASSSETHRPVTKAQAGRAYLAATKPVNTAFASFYAKDGVVSGTSTVVPRSQAVADAQPLINALAAFEPRLSQLAVSYPAAATDLKSQLFYVGAVLADLESISTLTTANEASWVQKFVSDENQVTAKANLVRADLGLAPIG